MNWRNYFLNLAHSVSLKSKDTTKVGCVIVGEDNEILSTGWNGFARGVNDSNEFSYRQERPAKYDWTIHAEANAICNAARSGVRLKGATAYVTHQPCSSCADMLIQSGIKCVYFDEGALVGDWKGDMALLKFEEAGVSVFKENGKND